MLGRTLRRFSAAADLLRPATFFRTLARVGELGDTTRQLATTVEQLQIRTEQLLTIHRLDTEQRTALDQLPRLLDPERIGRHVSTAVEQSPLHLDPFPHVVVEQWLPQDVYDGLIMGLPPAIFFAGREERRQRLMVPLPMAPAYSLRVWRFMAEEIVGRILRRTLNEKFHGAVRDYVRTFDPAVPEGTDITLSPSDGHILLRRRGYVIEPHRDPKWGFVTALVYLARQGDNEAYGTQLYRVSADAEAPDARPFYPDRKRCQLARSIPFRANTMLVFLNSTGAHGASIPADAEPADLERYVYQFRLGPDKQAIRHLLSQMPADRRSLWAGAKSDRAVEYV